MSETDKCRERLSQYCVGMGLDIGYGGSPITPTAITLDLKEPYAIVEPNASQNLIGDCGNLYWFKNDVFDYIYSSHLLEDFNIDLMNQIFWEWVRVVKPEGYIVLYLPNEQKYRAHCEKNKTHRNASHKIDNLNLELFKNIVGLEPNVWKLSGVKIIHENLSCEEYSFEIVYQKKEKRE